MIEYELIRSNRKTLTIQVKPDGSVIVRAPVRLAKYRIAKFVKDYETWITDEERQEGILQAKKIFPERTVYFAERMGVTYNRITIREQKTRWGSCSSAGNLNFNWKLVLMPSELLDYVVVHELAHRKEMNHSPRFWAVVEKELPDYRERREKLKKMGKQLG